MKLLHFSGGPTPTEGLPMALMSAVFAAAGKWKKHATMADLRYGVALVPGLAADDCVIPYFEVKNHLALLFERGEKARVQVGADALTLGMSMMGHWVWSWNGPVELDDRPPFGKASGWGSAIHWLCTGERGQSSEAMCRALYGVPATTETGEAPHPRDADDLRRCRGFLEFVPEARLRLAEIASLSPTWKVYVEHWDEMNRLFDEEAALGRLTRTTDLMRKLQAQAS